MRGLDWRVSELDCRLFDYHVVATMAHVHGLTAAGLLSADQAVAALGALVCVAADPPRSDGPAPSDGPSDAAACESRDRLTRILRVRLGAGTAALAVGLGDRDRLATAIRLWTRDAILDTAALLIELRQALTDLAERSGDALAPGVEPPVLLGHELLAYVEQFYRDGNRLKEVYVRADILPLGAGDGAGVEVVLDRAYVARLLGMHANTRNSVDAVYDRDFAIEHLAALATIGARVARLTADRARRALPTDNSTPLMADDAARATADEWRAAITALASMPPGYSVGLNAIETAQPRAVERTQVSLRRAIDGVSAEPLPPAGASRAAGALDHLMSRGGTAPALVVAAIAETRDRIDTFRRWVAERRAAHSTVDALRRFPADRQVEQLPHNDPPARRP